MLASCCEGLCLPQSLDELPKASLPAESICLLSNHAELIASIAQFCPISVADFQATILRLFRLSSLTPLSLVSMYSLRF
jgi:hypothetical protein